MKSNLILEKEQKPEPFTRKKNSRLLNAAWLLMGLLSFTMWQCKNDDYKETTGICPEVISTVPANNAINVVANKPITVTFNETMNATTITTSTFLVNQGTNPVSGVITPASGEAATFTFTPASPLAPFTVYKVTMKKGVKDPMNNMLQEDYVWSFTTQPLLTLSANPALGGTVTGGGLYNQGTAVTAGVLPNAGYVFANWTEAGVVVSTLANYPFALAGNRTLVANFTAQYNIAITSNPVAGGITTGAGAYNSGASAILTAVPNMGYTFTNWTEGANIVSTTANYTFNVTANRVLVANFAAVVVQLTVATSSNPPLSGTTTGGGSFNSGASVTVGAVPAVGFTFTNWTEGANIVSTNANYSFTINSNKTLVANFDGEQTPQGPGAIDLKSSGDFSILSQSGISSTGITSVQGDIGVSPAAASAITGFGLIMNTDGQSSHTTIATHVTGKVYASDYAPPTPSKLTVAIVDMQGAYTTANNLVTPAPVLEQGAGNLSGLTLAPGLYKWSTGVLIASNSSVTLSGGANDTWVFQIAQDLTLLTGAKVNLIGGAQAKNITWVVAGQAVLGSQTELYGTIMSKTLISLNTGAKVTGRLLAQTAVTLNASTVVQP